MAISDLFISLKKSDWFIYLLWIAVVIVVILIITKTETVKIDTFEEIPNNFNTDLNPINLTTNVIQDAPLENNMQSQNAIHNEIIGFNNDLNQYAGVSNFSNIPASTTTPNCDFTGINPLNQISVLNSFIGAQLTDKQVVQDSQEKDIATLRAYNAGKYSDIYAWSNQNPENVVTSVDKINEIRTSGGVEKFSDYGKTLWEAFDNIVKIN